MKKFSWLAVVVIILGVTAGWDYLRFGWWNGRDDFRIGIFSPEGLGLVSISPERRMVNVLKIEGQMKVWVPGGFGWYRADKITKLLDQEKKKNLEDQILFYNFGFVPKRMMMLSGINEWNQWQNLGWRTGWVNGLRIKSLLSGLLVGEDAVEGKLEENRQLDEILVRDMSDNLLVNEELRLSLINSSGESGLANWLATRIGWMGGTVVGIRTADIEVAGCEMVAGNGAEKTLGYKMIVDILGCRTRNDGQLGDYEVELYLGKEWAWMIKYSTYVGAF